MKRIGYIGFALLLIGLSVPAPAMSVQSNDFSIGVLVGDDTEPPTTPVISAVVPVATSQIDISWLPSIDNWLLAGYVVARDGSPIATTAAAVLTLSDSGLSPATLYSYTVTAFDASGNYSSSSVPVATTTLALPPPVATSTATTSSVPTNPTAAMPLAVLESLQIIAERTTAALLLTTARPTQFVIRWGETPEYEQETVRTETFLRQYTYSWDGLRPATRYYIQIVGINARGVETILHTGSFMTKSLIAETLIPNVRWFSAQHTENAAIRLSWQWPTLVPAGAVVRVLRNERRFPIGPEDGVLVYQGLAESVVDTVPWRSEGRIFYSIFVLVPDGRSSSGLVTSVWLGPQTDLDTETRTDDDDTATTTLQVPGIRLPDLTELLVVQGARTTPFSNSPIMVQAGLPILLQVPFQSVAPHIKSIIVTFRSVDQTLPEASYLLRLDETGEWYQGLLDLPEVTGALRLWVEIYDFEAAIVGRYRATLVVTPASLVDTTLTSFEVWSQRLAYFGWILIAIWFLWLGIRRLRSS